MPATNNHSDLLLYKQEMKDELAAILQYWQQHTPDYNNGGFLGKINNENIADEKAAKGVVLHARILWTFSAAYRITGNESYLQTAQRAFDYLLCFFRDDEYGGVYWSVKSNGEVEDSRKQIYGLAFAMYGMSEYYAASQKEEALQFATGLFAVMETYSFDGISNGYHEAFARNWQPLDDVRLSARDANASKTMNTHLHIIEAYANLYRIWRNDRLKERIENLLYLFDKYFIDPQTHHLILFFDEVWNEQPDVVSYGHDIEAAWLLLQCAEVIDHTKWKSVYREHARAIADAASEGVDKDGGLWYEYAPQQNRLIRQKHWWPQAEAMIGFLNAYQLSGEASYLEKSVKAWRFTKTYILDKENGEWFWGIDDTYAILPGEDKAGFWKCPYHNARACMEVVKRIDEINNPA